MPLINRAVIAQLREAVGDHAFGEIATDFVNDSKRLEDDLRRALRTGDPERARSVAHELRGLASLFGADALARTCKAVEAAGGAALKEASRATKACAGARDSLKQLLREDRAEAS